MGMEVFIYPHYLPDPQGVKNFSLSLPHGK